MPSFYRLTLALAVTVLCAGCAEGLSNLPWTNTETSMSSKKVRAPNGGRWGTLETTTTCNTYYIGATEQRRECGVSEKYVPRQKEPTLVECLNGLPRECSTAW